MSNAPTANATATATFPVFALATTVLFVLKVAGMAGASWGLPNLSWFWVFFPFILGITLFFVFLMVFIIIAVIASK